MTKSQPSITGNLLTARNAIPNQQRTILLIGQKVSGGSAASGALVQNLLTKNDFVTYFGAKSHLTYFGARVFDLLAPSIARPRIDAIGFSDAGGDDDPATLTIALAGTSASADGEFVLKLDSQEITISVTSGQTPTQIATAIKNAINAAQTSFNNFWTADSSSGTVTITCNNTGKVGNVINSKLTGSAAGITPTFTAWTGGDTDPTLDLDAIQDIRETTIVYPSAWDIQDIKDFLAARFNIENDILDSLVLQAKTDSFANVSTYILGNGSDIDPIDDKQITILPNKLNSSSTKKHGGIFEYNDIIAATIASARELRLTPNATISHLTLEVTRGGTSNAALPYHETPFTNLPLIANGEGFINEEITSLKTAGAWVLRNNRSRTAISSDSAISTYKSDNLGNPDTTYRFVEQLDTLSAIREYYFNNLKRDFGQKKLTTGDKVPGQPMVNRGSFISVMCSYYQVLSGAEYGLMRAGEMKEFKQMLEDTIVITLSTGTVTNDLLANIVTQLRNVIINFIPDFGS